MPKSPSEYEKFICENVIKNSQKFQSSNPATILHENSDLLCKNLIKNHCRNRNETDEESESEEIDLVTTRSPENSYVLDFSNNNNNHQKHNESGNKNNNNDNSDK